MGYHYVTLMEHPKDGPMVLLIDYAKAMMRILSKAWHCVILMERPRDCLILIDLESCLDELTWMVYQMVPVKAPKMWMAQDVGGHWCWGLQRAIVTLSEPMKYLSLWYCFEKRTLMAKLD